MFRGRPHHMLYSENRQMWKDDITLKFRKTDIVDTELMDGRNNEVWAWDLW
jgi:hypothetical protein